MSSVSEDGMKRTGIIRRIDDLGRIVIPREIRNILRLQEDDPLEMFIRDDTLILIKHNVQRPVRKALKNLWELVEKDPNLKCSGELQEKIREMSVILNQELESAD